MAIILLAMPDLRVAAGPLRPSQPQSVQSDELLTSPQSRERVPHTWPAQWRDALQSLAAHPILIMKCLGWAFAGLERGSEALIAARERGTQEITNCHRRSKLRQPKCSIGAPTK